MTEPWFVIVMSIIEERYAFFIGALIFVAGLLLTCVGVVVGICALCDRTSRSSKVGMTLSVLAAALPVVAAVTIVLLFSTGVIRISLM